MKTFLLGLALLISLSGFSNEEPKNVFSVFPAVVKKSAKLNINAPFDGWATFELRDKCGNVVLEQQMAVNKGMNTIPVFFISKIDKGEYTSVLKIEDKVFFSKLVKE